MKFCLIISVLLVPLAFADLSTQVVTKFLYRNDYVISQSFYDAQEIVYYYDGQLLLFHTRSNDSRKYVDFMSIEPSYRMKKTGGFAIETYPYGENDKPDSDFCWDDQFDKKLRPIRACNGRIRFREMTKEERKQIDEYQNENRGQSLQVTYNRGQITTRSSGFREFNVEQSKSSGDQTNFIVWTDYLSMYRRKMHLVGEVAEKAFVVEDLSSGHTDCRETNVTGLEIPLCYGNIKVRPLN